MYCDIKMNNESKNEILQSYKKMLVDLQYTSVSLFHSSVQYLDIYDKFSFPATIVILMEKIVDKTNLLQNILPTQLIFWIAICIILLSQYVDDLNKKAISKNAEYKQYGEEILNLFKIGRIKLARYRQAIQSDLTIDDINPDAWLYRELEILTEKYYEISKKMPTIPKKAYEKTRQSLKDGSFEYKEEEFKNL